MNAGLIGRMGERCACRYLKSRGYRLLARNYTALGCEIDLVMRHKDTLVFVEVKTRGGNDFGYGREAVDERKQRKVIVAAKAYMKAKQCEELPARFDVVEIDTRTSVVEHIIAAFDM